MQPIPFRPRYWRRGAALAAAALMLAACSSSSSSSTSSASSQSANASSSKHLTIAYLSFAVENSYDAPMLAAAEAVASDNNATLKVFDANNNPQTQYSQLQDAITSGQYQGIILQPIFGTGLISLVQQAIAKGIKVVNMDQVLGPNYSTDAPQVKGLAPAAVASSGALTRNSAQSPSMTAVCSRSVRRRSGLPSSPSALASRSLWFIASTSAPAAAFHIAVSQRGR